MVLDLINYDLPSLYVLILGTPSITYSILGTAIGYGAWDRFIRKAFRIHICIEQGSALYEMKSFKVPIRKAGTLLHWSINRKDKTEGKSYVVNPKHVYMTDRFNKSHIIQPYDNVFAYHPFSEAIYDEVKREGKDEKGEPVEITEYIPSQKVSFKKLAIADADALYQTTSKHGLLYRTEALRNKLKVTKEGLYMGILVGAAIGIMVGFQVMPHYITPNGFVPANLNATVINHTITQTVTSTSSSGHIP